MILMASHQNSIPPNCQSQTDLGKESFKCGMASAECEMRSPQIAQISFPVSASSAKSAVKTSYWECRGNQRELAQTSPPLDS